MNSATDRPAAAEEAVRTPLQEPPPWRPGVEAPSGPGHAGRRRARAARAGGPRGRVAGVAGSTAPARVASADVDRRQGEGRGDTHESQARRQWGGAGFGVKARF